ncbi:MAG TPA: 3'-5' exonuclease [Patescibacteria group bacterium]|nr:3'-5' exonuclease [Patescibacteria group bacterium]
MDFSKLAFVDVETTGYSAQHGRVIELGVLRVENGKIVDTLNQLVDPEVPLNPFIIGLTGIREEELERAPTFYTVTERLQEILQDTIFVAHCVDFDYGFIREEMKRVGLHFSMPRLCTRNLSRALFPEQRRHGVDALMEVHSLQCENRHRAFDDAEVLWKFWQKCSISEQGTLLKKHLKMPRVPRVRYVDDIE